MNDMLRVLRIGMSGPDVSRWNAFLVSQQYRPDSDGRFGPLTFEETKNWQSRNSLKIDGVVGPQTVSLALRQGLSVFDDDPAIEQGEDWPACKGFRSLTSAGRERLFGHFQYRPANISRDPDTIHIDQGWVDANIVTIHVPISSFYFPSDISMRVHRLAAPRIELLFRSWDKAGLLPLVQTFAGAWVPRTMRGSQTLSSHAWGSAFDINAAWNGLGRVPARKGAIGSVRELVAIANDLGFFWGGHFKHRRDGMHFEIAELP